MRQLHSVRKQSRAMRPGRAVHPKAEAHANLLKTEVDILRAFCRGHQSPRTLMIKLLVENQEWDQLVRLTCEQGNYLEHQADLFRNDYQATAMLSKSPTLPTSFSRSDEAVRGFYAAEAQCAATNARISLYAEGRLLPTKLDVHRSIHNATRFIERILGTAPSRGDLEYAERKMRFGPGSTTSLSRVVTTGAKYTRRKLDVTPRLVNYGIWCLPDLWKPMRDGLTIRLASKFTTVAKNAKTDRGICIEPDLNIFVQLGTGALLRKKLRHSGLDLDHAADWNRYLASVALDWRLTTLDLSAASDTVAREVVWLLAPERWCELLLLSRVDKTLVRDREVSLEKWSSMGNGYTFELESLLFWGILNGCLETLGLGNQQSACFGDDLIFPSEARELVESTLEFLGFSVNRGKTFSTGLFRESCGKDFFNSVDVRPYYFKGARNDVNEEIDLIQVRYSYANKVRRWSAIGCHPNRSGPACDSRSLPAFLAALSSIPTHLRLRIPDGCGDNGVIGSWDECQQDPHVTVRAPRGPFERGWGGTFYREYFRPLELDKRHPYGAYVATLAGQAREASKGQPMRGRFGKATTRWAYTLVWPNLGPWL